MKILNVTSQSSNSALSNYQPPSFNATSMMMPPPPTITPSSSSTSSIQSAAENITAVAAAAVAGGNPSYPGLPQYNNNFHPGMTSSLHMLPSSTSSGSNSSNVINNGL